MAGRKFQIGNVSSFIVKKDYPSAHADDIKLAGKKQNLDPMWKLLNKEVDLGEPTSFLDHVYFGCTQRQCEISKEIVDNYRTMLESRISAGGVKKLPFTQNLRISSWSYDMADHAKKCVERYCDTVKEQFAPEENRDIALFNLDNEFNRAINEENIDFNTPGVPHSKVKRSHGVNVRNLIQKIENHPQRHALQSDLQQLRRFNPFSKESQDVIKAAGNTELCDLLDLKPKAQCKVCLSYWNVGIVY